MRPLLPVLALVRARAFAFLAAASLAGAAVADQILEMVSVSLETYMPATPTLVQNVCPTAKQRGTNVDGSLRAASTFRMALAGNPLENTWRGESTINDVRLDTGTYQPTSVDLSLPAPGFRWTVGRTYSASQDDSGHHVSQGAQGANWFQTSQPELLLYVAAQGEDDMVYLVYGADRFAEFKRFDSDSDQFKGMNGAAGAFEFAAGAANEPDTYTYSDQAGIQYVFFGFDDDADPAKGQLWKIIDLTGSSENVAYVGDKTTGSTAISSGYDANGRIEKAYDTASRRYTYTYSTLDGTKRLTQVKAETKTGGSWASPTGVSEVGRVDYSYYSDESYGDVGDLKLVTITTPLSDSGVSDVRKTYFRYWEGTFNASTNPGHPHALKLVVDFEGTRNYDWREVGTGEPEFDDGFLTASHESLKPYAHAYFEYDASYRIDEMWFNGECGCSGGLTGTHYLEYETSGYTNDAGYDNEWARRTVVKRPDDSYMTQYFDETGQPLHHVITDADPDNTDPVPQRWATKVTRDSMGMVSEVATPASVTGYTHSSGTITLSSTDGLIHTFSRLATGDMKGFMTDRKYQEGTGGSAYLDLTLAYDSFTKTVGDVTITRPLVDERRVYSQAITSGTTGSYNTTYTYTAHSGTLGIEKIVTTHPAVSSGNNGSGSTVTSQVHYDLDGTMDFQEAADDRITFMAYENGQVVRTVKDADTSDTGSGGLLENETIPTGFATSGTAVQWATDRTYDAQGRLDTVTTPDGRVEKHYYTKRRFRLSCG